MIHAGRHGLLGTFVLAILAGAAGCARSVSGDSRLRIVTAWPMAERSRLESEFGGWLAAAGESDLTSAGIDWVVLEPGDDPARLLSGAAGAADDRPAPVDVVLGGPSSTYGKLARTGRLVALDAGSTPPWRIVRRAPLGWAVNAPGAASGSAAEESNLRSLPIFDDPRHDPIALTWAKVCLAAGTWAEGYAALVQAAGHSRPIGRQPRSALAAIARGEAVRTPALASEIPAGAGPLTFSPVADAPEYVEGAAVVRGGRRRSLAELFLRFLGEKRFAEVPAARAGSESDALLADLLGATLVDAQDELWTAWAVLKRTGHPQRAEMWMVQAPPWPPASVAKLIERDRSGVLLDTLAAELAPDPEIRAALVRSWLSTARLIDDRLLDELAGAVGGRLAGEPRFRAWLRAEWTAWARQRYRRVARKAGEAVP